MPRRRSNSVRTLALTAGVLYCLGQQPQRHTALAWQAPIGRAHKSAAVAAHRSPLFQQAPRTPTRQHASHANEPEPSRRRKVWKRITSFYSNPRTSFTSLETKPTSSADDDIVDTNGLAALQQQKQQHQVFTETEMLQRMEELQKENRILKETVEQLETDKAQLEYEAVTNKQRLVLETFEGEGEEWCDELEDGACPVEPDVSFGQAFRDRAVWLVGLLLLQSFSGIILSRNEALIADHPFIVYFLTMLVGAGGNAGNQASVRVIRGLALGTLNDRTQSQFLVREFKMAMSLSSLLTVAGFVRAAAFNTPFPESIAVTTALFLIVFSSICLGAVLPLGLKRLGVDPAHSSTSIQVIMDILGVILAVTVSSLLLDSPMGIFLISKLTGS